MSPSPAPRPPRLAEALLALLLPGDGIRETVLGDLHELYLRRLRDPDVGRGGARLWYRTQALRLAVGYGVRRLRGSRLRGFAPAPRPSEVKRDRLAGGDALAGVVRQIRLSFRALMRSPGFTVPALLILAIGMTAATAIFTVVDSIVFRPLAYPESERLVLLCEEHTRMGDACVMSPGNAADLRSEAASLVDLGIGRGWAFSIDDDGVRYGVRGGLATGSLFRTLGIQPHIGRFFADDETGPDNDKVLLLSHSLWLSRYGADSTVIGRTVRVEGEPSVIVGVLPAAFDAPLDMDGIEAWRPPYFDLLDPEVRGWRGWSAIGRLAPDVARQASTDELSALYSGLASIHDEINDEWRLRVRPLLDAVVGDTRPVFYAFLAAAGLLLVIVCANVANLLLARGLGRRQELAVRAALGAGRRRLIGEILCESLILTAVATALAVAVTGGATQLILAMAPADVPRLGDVAFGGRILAFAAGVSVLATAAFAVLPALRVTAWNLGETVRSGGGAGESGSSSRLRGGLVVAELSLCVVLLASAALLSRSFAQYLEWSPGFDRQNFVVVSAFLSPEKYVTRSDLVPVYREAEAALAGIPGVVSASSASAGPLFGGGDGQTLVATQAWDGTGQLPSARWFDVGPGYFETLGVPLVRGREFRESDDAGSGGAVVVNEALARTLWPGAEAVGEVIRLPDRESVLEVVGVVADVPSIVPGEATAPEMYWPNRQLGRWGTFFVLRAEREASSAAAAATDVLLTVDPDLTLGAPRTLSSFEARALVRPRFQAVVLLAFALAALALSAVGVYAVVSYRVERRIREMGIRMALGAAPLDVVSLVVRSSLGVALLGVALGVVGALAAGQVLRGMLHGVSPADPVSLGVAVTLLLASAAVASVVPAYRATRADPLSAIRSE